MAKKSVILHFWSMPNAGFDTGRITEIEIRHFKKLYPHIDVKYNIIPWSLAWSRIMDVVKGKRSYDLPDVIQIGNTWLPTLVYMDGLLNIADRISEVTETDFIPQLWDNNKHSVPWFADLRVLYYRKDIFADLDISLEDIDDWDSFSNVCKKIKSSGKKIFPLALSGQKEAILMHDLAPWVWSAGGNFLSEDGKKCLLNSEKALQGIKFYFGLIDKGFIPLEGREGALPIGNFFTGHYAMQFSGVWPLKSFFNKNYPDYNPTVAKNYGVALFPKGPECRITYIGGSNLAIVKSTKFPEESWKFIKYLISRDSQKRYVSAVGMVPVVFALFDDFFNSHSQAKEVFKKSLEYARAIPDAVALGAVEQALAGFTEKVLGLLRKGKYSEEIMFSYLKSTVSEINYMLSLFEAK